MNKRKRTTFCSSGLHGTNFIEADGEDDEKVVASSQFLPTKKNKLLGLQDWFQRYVNTLLLFGFNSARYNLNLIKSCLVPPLVNENGIEPIVNKKNQFISFKSGNIQFPDVMNFLGGPTSPDYFLKTYKTSETKKFLP